MSREYESPSSIKLYRTCPKKYEFKYIQKLPDPSGAAAELGTAFHNAAYDTWESASVGTYKLQIADMLRAMYLNKDVLALPRSNAMFETKIQVPCGSGKLLGYVDMILDERTVAVDFKTSGKKYTAQTIEDSLQHLAYTFALRKLGFPIKKFIYIVIGTKAVPFVQVITVSVSPDALSDFELNFDGTLAQIAEDLFYVRTGQHCRWCPYKNVCPAFSSYRPQP